MDQNLDESIGIIERINRKDIRRKELTGILEELDGSNLPEEAKTRLRKEIGEKLYLASDNCGTAYDGISAAYFAVKYGLGKPKVDEALRDAEIKWEETPNEGYIFFGGGMFATHPYPQEAYEFDRELLKQLSEISEGGFQDFDFNLLEMRICKSKDGSVKELREQRREFLNQIGVEGPQLKEYSAGRKIGLTDLLR